MRRLVFCLLFLFLLPACGEQEKATPEISGSLGAPSPEYDLSAWEGIAQLTVSIHQEEAHPSHFSIEGLLENISPDVELQSNCFWSLQYCSAGSWYTLSFQDDAPPLVYNDSNIAVQPGKSVQIQGDNLTQPHIYYGELPSGLYRLLGKIGRFDTMENKYVYDAPIIAQFTVD